MVANPKGDGSRHFRQVTSVDLVFRVHEEGRALAQKLHVEAHRFGWKVAAWRRCHDMIVRLVELEERHARQRQGHERPQLRQEVRDEQLRDGREREIERNAEVGGVHVEHQLYERVGRLSLKYSGNESWATPWFAAALPLNYSNTLYYMQGFEESGQLVRMILGILKVRGGCEDVFLGNHP